MKEIKVSDEECRQLMQISHELNTQDNLATADPIWAIFDKQKIPTTFDYSDKYYWYNSVDDWKISEREVKEMLQDAKDEFTKQYKQTKKKLDRMYTTKMERHKEILSSMGFEQIFYIEVPTKPQGIFFTAKACRQWRKQNGHHLSDQAYNFVLSLWRNPEMQLIRKILLTLKDRINQEKKK